MSSLDFKRAMLVRRSNHLGQMSNLAMKIAHFQNIIHTHPKENGDR
jgi:hypothetical protein